MVARQIQGDLGLTHAQDGKCAGGQPSRRQLDATPVDPDEAAALIPGHIQTQIELNQWEAVNIADAAQWAARRHGLDVLSSAALKELHRRMFGHTWAWAGTFRQSDKNLSPYRWSQIPELVENLVENTRARYSTGDKSPGLLDDLALYFHHELVRIHPWPNGNGRHARLATDLLLRAWGRPAFTWGHDELTSGEVRARYIAALQRADANDYSLLRDFVRG